MPHRDVVVVGASAGGVEALRELAAGLPVDFPGTVLVVLHVPPTGSSALPQILDRAGPLPARQAEDGDRLKPGQILVAAPNKHLIVYDGRVTLSSGPRENGHRPAVDVLFRTAARVLGPRLVGVILSGALDDGTAGMVAVQLRGGATVVQSPDEALHPSMPRSAMSAVDAQHVLPVAKIPPLLMELVSEEVPDDPGQSSALMITEAAMADLDLDAINKSERPGRPSGLSCPDCNGTLFEIEEGGLVRYRCRVGHAWSPASLVAQQASALEGALWMALRSLEEKAALTADLARQASAAGHNLSGTTFERESQEARKAAGLVRDLIGELTGGTEDKPVADSAKGG
ncbi:MAG TPA: chemotaxis protein CheB [Marmoricola sp.]|nr:chemotaxis protein CheB [Marmoricola sp.]